MTGTRKNNDNKGNEDRENRLRRREEARKKIDQTTIPAAKKRKKNPVQVDEEETEDRNHGEENQTETEEPIDNEVADDHQLNTTLLQPGELNPDDEDQLVEFYIAFARLTEEKRTYYMTCSSPRWDGMTI